MASSSSYSFPLSALHSRKPLKLAIVGPDKAGKTTLTRHILQQAHEVVQPRAQAPLARLPNPILVRLTSSRITALFVRSVTFLHSLIQQIFRKPEAEKHIFLPTLASASSASDPASYCVIWDAKGIGGVESIPIDDVDAILFVTRLDHSRIDRQDKLLLDLLVRLSGDEILHKLVFILTHAHALPPLNLSYSDYVRGRTHMLEATVRECVRPVAIRPENADEAAKYVDGTEHMTRDEQLGHASKKRQFVANPREDEEENALTLYSHIPGAVPGDDGKIDPCDPYNEIPGSVKTLFGVLGNDDDTDKGSVTELPDSWLDDLIKSGIKEEDDREFANPPMPPVVPVELADGCPRDEDGERILASGERWFGKMIEVIGQVGGSSEENMRASKERKDALRREWDAKTGRPERKLRDRLLGLLQSLSNDAVRMVIFEFAVVMLVYQIGTRMQVGNLRERERRKREEDDVLLKLSDEEYERLTRPDAGSGGNVIIGDVDDDDEVLQETEDEFFGRTQGNGEDDEREGAHNGENEEDKERGKNEKQGEEMGKNEEGKVKFEIGHRNNLEKSPDEDVRK